MKDEELLTVTQSLLRDAVQKAEFTRSTKDLQYVLVVATKIENLKAKIDGSHAPVEVALVRLVGGRVEIVYTMNGVQVFASVER